MISTIRTQADVRGLLEVFTECWGAEALYELMASILDTTCLLHKDATSKEVVGYVFYGRDERDNSIEITDIGVAPGHRGQGIGKALVEAVCLNSDCIRLVVKLDNNAARQLYKALGFQEILLIPNYYGVDGDGVRMEWKRQLVDWASTKVKERQVRRDVKGKDK